MKIRFLHRKQTVPPERLQATVMIHLGMAWRAQQEGDVILAIRRLSMATEVIMQLIEEWSGTELKTEVVVDERVDQVPGPHQRHLHLPGEQGS